MVCYLEMQIVNSLVSDKEGLYPRPPAASFFPRGASINNQTEIVNGERGHYLVWSVRLKG